MGQISVTISGQKYNLACRDGEEERLAMLAEFVKDKTENLLQTLGPVGENRLMLMAALLVADELHDAKDQMEALANGDNAALTAAVEERVSAILDKTSEQIEALADRLEANSA